MTQKQQQERTSKMTEIKRYEIYRQDAKTGEYDHNYMTFARFGWGTKDEADRCAELISDDQWTYMAKEADDQTKAGFDFNIANAVARSSNPDNN